MLVVMSDEPPHQDTGEQAGHRLTAVRASVRVARSQLEREIGADTRGQARLIHLAEVASGRTVLEPSHLLDDMPAYRALALLDATLAELSAPAHDPAKLEPEMSAIEAPVEAAATEALASPFRTIVKVKGGSHALNASLEPSISRHEDATVSDADWAGQISSHDEPPAVAGLRAAEPLTSSPVTDNLTRIRGVTQQLALGLASLGITRFEQIAAWNRSDRDHVASSLNLGRQISREGWIEQAAMLALSSSRQTARTGRIPVCDAVAAVAHASPTPLGGPFDALHLHRIKTVAEQHARADLTVPDGPDQRMEADDVGLSEPAATPFAEPPLIVVEAIALEVIPQDLRQQPASQPVAGNETPIDAGQPAASGEPISSDVVLPPGQTADQSVSDSTVLQGGETRAVDPEAAVLSVGSAVLLVAGSHAPDHEPAPLSEPVAPQAVASVTHEPEVVSEPEPEEVVLPAPQEAFTLEHIRGVSPQLADRLRACGVHAVEDIARWSSDEVATMSVRLGRGAQISRDQWIEQAAALSSGRATAFSRSVDRGERAIVVARPWSLDTWWPEPLPIPLRPADPACDGGFAGVPAATAEPIHADEPDRHAGKTPDPEQTVSNLLPKPSHMDALVSPEAPGKVADPNETSADAVAAPTHNGVDVRVECPSASTVTPSSAPVSDTGIQNADQSARAAKAEEADDPDEPEITAMVARTAQLQDALRERLGRLQTQISDIKIPAARPPAPPDRHLGDAIDELRTLDAKQSVPPDALRVQSQQSAPLDAVEEEADVQIVWSPVGARGRINGSHPPRLDGQAHAHAAPHASPREAAFAGLRTLGRSLSTKGLADKLRDAARSRGEQASGVARDAFAHHAGPLLTNARSRAGAIRSSVGTSVRGLAERIGRYKSDDGGAQERSVAGAAASAQEASVEIIRIKPGLPGSAPRTSELADDANGTPVTAPLVQAERPVAQPRPVSQSPPEGAPRPRLSRFIKALSGD